jgi:methylthioribose-1-phosphate isomerase
MTHFLRNPQRKLKCALFVLDRFAIRYNQGDLSILNQQKLPHEEKWIDVRTSEQMVEIITSLKVQ